MLNHVHMGFFVRIRRVWLPVQCIVLVFDDDGRVACVARITPSRHMGSKNLTEVCDSVESQGFQSWA